MSQESEGSQFPIATSSRNTGIVPQHDTASALAPKDRVQAVDVAAAGLELQIEQLRAERKIERFFWLFALVAITTTFIVSFVPWGAGATLVLFALIFLIGAARWLEVPWVARHLERWFDRASMTKARNETE